MYYLVRPLAWIIVLIFITLYGTYELIRSISGTFTQAMLELDD